MLRIETLPWFHQPEMTSTTITIHNNEWFVAFVKIGIGERVPDELVILKRYTGEPCNAELRHSIVEYLLDQQCSTVKP